MVGLVAGVVVGAALVSAGVLKLVAGPAWLKQAADMDVSRPIALAVPYLEIVIGAPLLAQVLRPWPAIAAFGLLVVFTVVIVRRLADGSRPPCGCFGARSQRPLGAYHLVRNLTLLGATLLAVVA